MQTQSSSTVIGVFTDLENAEQAVQDLKMKSVGTSVRLIENDFSEDFNAKTPSSLNGTNSSPNRTPEHEGGISGFFSRLFGFDDEQPSRDLKLNSNSELYFSDSYQKKHHFVIVEGCNDVSSCEQIITSLGGTIEHRGSELYEQERTASTRSGAALDNETVMELREEQLRVETERFQTGEVHLRKEIVEEVQHFDVPVTREEIVIETRPLTGAARPGSLDARDIGESREIRIPVSEERVHVEKEVVPREEIRVSKQSITENQTVSEQVKKEKAVLEEDGRVAMSAKDKAKFKPSTNLTDDDLRPGL